MREEPVIHNSEGPWEKTLVRLNTTSYTSLPWKKGVEKEAKEKNCERSYSLEQKS